MNQHINDPLTAICSGEIDDDLFDHFLECFASYRRLAFETEKIPSDKLVVAARAAIRFAAEKRHKYLIFSYDGYELRDWNVPDGTKQGKDALIGTPMACHAPDYSELVDLCHQGIGLISSPNKPSDTEVHRWLGRAIDFVNGGRQMVDARRILQERYSPYKTEPERDCEIDEILRVYRHLWCHAELEAIDEDNVQYIAKIDLGEVVPPFHEHGMDHETVIEYCYRIEERLMECGIVTRDMEHDQDDGIRLFIINDPSEWCRKEPDE